MKRVTVVRRRREPGECAPRWAAVRNHCLECVGYQSVEVERCTAMACWLYPWRFGGGSATEAATRHNPDSPPESGANGETPGDPTEGLPEAQGSE